MTKSIDDMDDFIAWMVREGRSPGTAKVYASNVRVLLKESGDRLLEQDFLDGIFDKIREEQPSLYPARLSGYNAWVDFQAEAGIEIVRPTKLKKKRRAHEAPPLPDEVCEAVRTLNAKCAMSFRILTLLNWEDVEFESGARGDFYHVKDPSKEGVHFRADADAIDTLLGWADPANLFLPLVPREPGSDQPYPLKALKREAVKGQETVKERVERLREERRRRDASALGAAGLNDRETVTPENYTSDYLPKVDKNTSVEGLLGLGGPAPAGQIQATSNASARAERAQSEGRTTGNGLTEGAGGAQPKAPSKAQSKTQLKDKRSVAEIMSEMQLDTHKPDTYPMPMPTIWGRPIIMSEELKSKEEPKPLPIDSAVLRDDSDYDVGYREGKNGYDQRRTRRTRDYRAGWADGRWERDSGDPSYDPPPITGEVEKVAAPAPPAGGLLIKPPVTGADGEIYDPNDPDYSVEDDGC